jgi:hypothetical protein
LSVVQPLQLNILAHLLMEVWIMKQILCNDWNSGVLILLNCYLRHWSCRGVALRLMNHLVPVRQLPLNRACVQSLYHGWGHVLLGVRGQVISWEPLNAATNLLCRELYLLPVLLRAKRIHQCREYYL